MSHDISILHKLYLKQTNLRHDDDFLEVLPLTFNYQDMIIVDTGVVPLDSIRVVFQTYSCGCGPQPTIKGGVLDKKIAWNESQTRQLLLDSNENKGKKLAGQTAVAFVYRIRKAVTGQDRQLVTRALEKQFGTAIKIGFF